MLSRARLCYIERMFFVILAALLTLLLWIKQFELRYALIEWIFYPNECFDIIRRKEAIDYSERELLFHIKNRCMVAPSVVNTKGEFENFSDLQIPQLKSMLGTLFKNTKNGFFVEAGALDGISLSNTLWLERQLNWTGLLVEPDKASFRRLLSSERNSWKINACLSVSSHPHDAILSVVSNEKTDNFLEYRIHKGQSFLSNIVPPSLKINVAMQTRLTYQNVHCFPLASMILALGRTSVDFISLDVEGAEEPVLKSFPWGSVGVKVWLVEHFSQNETFPDKEFILFFQKKGYVSVPLAFENSADYLFVDKKSTSLINNLKNIVL